MYTTRHADDGVAFSTLCLDLAAIRAAQLLAGISLDLHRPRLAMAVEGITRPFHQAAPTVPDMLRLLLTACWSAHTAPDARDCAMLLLGFGAALGDPRWSPFSSALWTRSPAEAAVARALV